MDAYAKHPYEDLTDAQLDELLKDTGIPFTAERRQNIGERIAAKKEKRPAKRRIRTRWLIPLVAILALALVGFAKHDVIAQLFVDIFGNRDIGQYAEPLSGSSTDNGIRMELLSGVHDGNSTYIVVSLTDETGTHKLENILMTAGQWELRGYGGLYGGNCRMVQYDEQTRIAYLLVHGVDGSPGKSATFRLKSFSCDKVPFDLSAPTIDLGDLVANHSGTFTPLDTQHAGMGYRESDVRAEVALEKGALSVEVPGFDRATLSNIGYQNGLLHIQLDFAYDTPNERITPYLLNPATGEIIQHAYSTNYDGTVDYEEHTFKVPDVGDLKDYVLCFEGWYYAETIAGNWQVSFVTPQQMDDVVAVLDEPLALEDGARIESLTLSPMNLMLSGAIPAGRPITVLVHYADGTTKTIEYMDDNSWLPFGRGDSPDNTASSNITFTYPIANFEDIVAVSINGVQIDMAMPGG